METLCFTEDEQKIRTLIHKYYTGGAEQGLDIITWLHCQTDYNTNKLTNIILSCSKKIIPPRYKEYLQSEYWRKLSSLAKTLANHHCQLCNKTGEIHTHHKTYERLGLERLTDLIVLCKHCHRKFHNK